MGENGYGRINIHADNDYAFGWACAVGDHNTAKWLIELGEFGGYGKIDIHAENYNAFKICCRKGNIDIAKWLIELGELGDYGKIDQAIITEYMKTTALCCDD